MSVRRSRGTLFQQVSSALEALRCRKCRGLGVAFRGRACGSCNGTGFSKGEVHILKLDDPAFEESMTSSKIIEGEVEKVRTGEEPDDEG